MVTHDQTILKLMYKKRYFLQCSLPLIPRFHFRTLSLLYRPSGYLASLGQPGAIRLIFIIPAPHCPGNITAKPLTLVFGRFVLHKKNILIASDLICL